MHSPDHIMEACLPVLYGTSSLKKAVTEIVKIVAACFPVIFALRSKVLHFSANYVIRFVQLLIGVYPGLIIKYVTGADTPSWDFICCPSAPACSLGMRYIVYLYSLIIQFQRIFAILFSVFTKMSFMSSFDFTRYKTIHFLKFMIQRDHIRPQSRYRYHPCVQDVLNKRTLQQIFHP